MWYSLGRFILKFRVPVLVVIVVLAAVWGFYASKIEMSYEFSKAIPTNNEKYVDYQAFLKKFGGDGNTMVIGVQTDSFYSLKYFNAVTTLHKGLKSVKGVVDVLSVPEAVTLAKDSSDKLVPQRIFNYPYENQQMLDSAKEVFENLPLYQHFLYNPDTKAYMLALTLNKDTANSKSRTRLINDILEKINLFESSTGTKVEISGLPYIRTVVADRIQKQMNWLLFGSLLLAAVTLMLFFRSVRSTIMSLLVVGMGVVASMATMVLLGYKITLLTALIPPLIVVIGVPNCIYFLNKYHTSYRETGDKKEALVTMVGRMGIVTLFCNIAAAIGFAVFSFTKSGLLQEFGVVSGINIMLLFFISLFFIPAVLSYLPAPKSRQMRYLDNKLVDKLLTKIDNWTFNKDKVIFGVTAVIVVIAIAGVFKLKKESFIVDDLPHNDKIYTDLKWFESNFGGVMPLEVVVDTKKRNGLVRNLKPIEKVDSFSKYIADRPETAKPISLIEGLKFARQAFYDGDSTYYAVPTEFDMPVMSKYLKGNGNNDSGGQKSNNNLAKLLSSFMDSTKQVARISINMKDIGSEKLPKLIDTFRQVANQTFDTANYKVTFTGTSITFVEGNNFIINGLKESIIWAFALIALCMLYLFRSFRILLCSLIPNVIPLLITAGTMGWAGILIKPSSVLVFSVALGIAIDVTIRFLVNYKQELPLYNGDVKKTLTQTIYHTGLSIIYTSLVLTAGFVIFCISNFGSIRALGWLTSLTLLTGTLTNLILLPVLIWKLRKRAVKTDHE